METKNPQQIHQFVFQYIFGQLCPNQGSKNSRERIFEKFKAIFSEILKDYKPLIMKFGSDPLRTYLPDSDIDITILLRHNLKDEMSEEYKLESSYIKTTFDRIYNRLHQLKQIDNQLSDIAIVDAGVKVVKFKYQGIPLDVSINQYSGVASLWILERFDRIFGRNHLFKKSMLLIKIWSFYEARILGSQYGCLSTFAIEVMTILLLNKFYDEITHPFDAFYKFLEFFSKVEFEREFISIYGIIQHSGESKPKLNFQQFQEDELLIKPSTMLKLKSELQGLLKECEVHSLDFRIKFVNIIDPLFEFNNLGKSVYQLNATRIKFSLNYFQKSFSKLQKEDPGYQEELLKLFKNSLESKNKKFKKPVPQIYLTSKTDPKAQETLELLHLYSYTLYPVYWGEKFKFDQMRFKNFLESREREEGQKSMIEMDKANILPDTLPGDIFKTELEEIEQTFNIPVEDEAMLIRKEL